MTAQQYLLSQAEHCRRVAQSAADPFLARELRRLASVFEQKATGDDMLASEQLAPAR